MRFAERFQEAPLRESLLYALSELYTRGVEQALRSPQPGEDSLNLHAVDAHVTTCEGVPACGIHGAEPRMRKPSRRLEIRRCRNHREQSIARSLVRDDHIGAHPGAGLDRGRAGLAIRHSAGGECPDDADEFAADDAQIVE